MAKSKKNMGEKEKNFVKKEVNEFKQFISRGNVVDMAIGVVIGSAFGKIVTSLVNDLLMPLIGIVMGGLDFSGLSIKIHEEQIAYGSFIQSVVDFLIIAFCIFVMIKFLAKFRHEEEKKAEVEIPVKKEEVQLLEEIRDLLKKEKEIKNKK